MRLFAPIAAQLDDRSLRELNAAVDINGHVVRELLEDEGFLSPRQLNK